VHGSRSRPDRNGSGRVRRARNAACLLLAALFLAGGIAHFVLTDAFAAIVPPPVPLKREIVLLTGAMELAFAAALLVPQWRPVTGVLLAAYMLAVLPANVFMATNTAAGLGLPPLLLWSRVAFQFPLIALALWATRRSA